MKLRLLFLVIVIVIVIVYRLRFGNVEAGTCGKWQREKEKEKVDLSRSFACASHIPARSTYR